MLISLNWLKQYVDIKESIDEIANALTMIGQEVEAIDIQGKDLNNVVIGQIVEFDKHPNSDRLTLLKVNVGEGEPLQIICGAKNHKLNDKVVVAKIGAVLPGNFKIKKSKIRDVESYGMLCSEAELGFAKESEGIIILPEDAPIGTEYREYMGLNDVIFELEITPNRPDCLSHIGIAREVAAYYNRKVKYPMVQMNETIESINTMVKVDIDDKDRCKRYMGRVIKNVKVQESPAWLKSRIRAMGLNPINNIVDITNFVMFEYNQPMHAFDLDKLEGNITIRAAKENEEITTLDGIDRVLKNGELVIADDEKAIAIAGVIGGQNTQIDNETKNVFVEVAYFTPENIRKTSRDLGIFTDSAYRNERGMDIENLNNVMARAVSLIAEVILSYNDVPYVIFGHCMGGFITHEVVRYIVKKKGKLPIAIFISGENPPHLPYRRDLHTLSDEELLQELKSINFAPEDFCFTEETILEMLPIIKGDFQLVDDWYFNPENSQIPIPICVYGGDEDEFVTERNIKEWEKYTTNDFKCRMLCGNHFFIKSEISRNEIINDIKRVFKTI